MEIDELCRCISVNLIEKSQKMMTAESCTGGWIAKSLTDLAGSSQWFDSGVVTYSNDSKMEMLGVLAQTLEKYGAVSEQTAVEMARAAVAGSRVTYALAVTGIAGPGGGTEDKPVGTVCFAWAKKDGFLNCETRVFSGSREKIRYQTVVYALQKLITFF